MRAAALFAFVAAGCAGQPKSGVWEYVDEVVESNSCGVDVDAGTSGDFRIDNNKDGTLTIDPDDGTDPFDCTFAGGDYECPDRFVDEIELFQDANAEVRASATGTFNSSISGSGTQTASLSCIDAGCTNVAAAAGISTPCAVTVSFGMAWVSE